MKQWCAPDYFLEQKKGDIKCHALLHCSLLLGIKVDAYVCVGQAMITFDVGGTGNLSFHEFLKMITTNPWSTILPDEVQKFLISCGNQNLSDLMVPSKLEKTLAELDTDKSGEVDLPEWCVSESQTLRGDGVLTG